MDFFMLNFDKNRFMLVLVSPAKTLDFDTAVPTDKFTKPAFLKYSREIQRELKQLNPARLQELMDISPKLAELNWDRNRKRKFTITGPGENVRQAVYAFNGDVYHGLDAYTVPQDKIEVMQQHIRILSGLYGLLRPLDLIMPYRLEMGTPLPVGPHRNLYDIWRPVLTKAVNREAGKGLVVNLASQEYFSALDAKKLKATVVSPEFRDMHNGELKMISFFAKKARGLMARFIIDTGAKTPEDLQRFDYGGYLFDAKRSTLATPVFVR